jgi:phage tail tape-measure protein
LKVSILAVALTTSLFIFATNTYAACNTVMGGCTVEETVNVSPHMRSDGGHQKKSAVKPADRAIKQPSTVAASKPAAKKL